MKYLKSFEAKKTSNSPIINSTKKKKNTIYEIFKNIF